MKKIFFLSLALFAATALFGQNNLCKATANYYYIEGYAAINAQATLNITSAQPLAIACDNNYVCFECETEDNGVDGGKIRVLLPQWRAAKFYAKYKDSKKPLPLSGTIKKYAWADGMVTIILYIYDGTN